MLKVALTGNIGSGKSFILSLFAQKGIPIFDCDAEVHKIYEVSKEFYEFIEENLPLAIREKKIIRSKVANYVQENPNFLEPLQVILFRILDQRKEAFIREQNAPYGLFDVPLLFEHGTDKNYDKIILIHAPKEIRWHRVKIRNNMTRKKFDFFCTKQVNYYQVKEKADFVFKNRGSYDKIKAIVDRWHNIFLKIK